MAKNAYQLVTDLHYSCSKRNRINYQNEIISSINDILSNATQLKEEGYSVHLVLLGDVCDTSINDSEEAMETLEILRYFFSFYKSVHSVVGNHEVTYYKSNPFWYLVSNIKDSMLNSYKRLIAPKGIDSVIDIDGTLVDGDVCFYFNHYDTPIKKPTTDYKINIGLFHQDVGSNEITKMWGDWVDVEGEGATVGYQYAFFGHMHLAINKYELDSGCIAEWLGSIGRTNVDEVESSILTRNVPAILITDGTLIEIRDMFIKLLSYDDCVDITKANAEKMVRKIAKERVEAMSVSYVGDNLKEAILSNVCGTKVELLCHKVFEDKSSLLEFYNKNILKED